MAKDTYYFSHDSNARMDPKITDMTYDYGMSGYGMYWVIVEVLREEGEYKLRNDKSIWRALAMQMHSKSDDIREFIDKCINEYKLFITDGEYFWSNSLNERMLKVENIKQKRKEAANKRWGVKEEESNSNANALQEDTTSNANLCKVKESKVKEKKVNESINSMFVEEIWSLYPKKQGKASAIKTIPKLLKEYSKEELIRCVERYSSEVKAKNTELQYVKNGSTFFNGGYLDYLDSNYKVGEVKNERERVYGFAD